MSDYHIDSPVGFLELQAREGRLAGIRFLEAPPDAVREGQADPVLLKAARQLEEYFSGRRTTFNLPLSLEGTDFQKAVWEMLLEIPYGWTVSYGELAVRLGDPRKVRAVGAANGRNPIPIVVPCHRVIGSDNSLTGYGGGVENKLWLLRHEGIVLM